MAARVTDPRRALTTQLNALHTTLQELQEYNDLGWFPSDRHRLLFALAQDLGIVGQKS